MYGNFINHNRIRDVSTIINRRMKLFEIQIYTTDELHTYEVTESVGDWKVLQSTAFKKGLKKYRHDKTVMNAFKELTDYIFSHHGVPPVRGYPPHLNIHQIKRDKRFYGALWGHLKGQSIGVMFYIKSGELRLVHMGTHSQLGWG